MTRFFNYVSAILFSAAASAFAQDGDAAVIHMKNGQRLQGQVAGVSTDALQWKVPEAAAGSRSIPYNQISWVEFTPTQEWGEALVLFYNNNYQEAIPKLQAISNSRGASTYYPAPGNFATLADRRLLDCYRRTMTAAEIPNVEKRIEWDKLPPSERDVQVVMELWSAVGIQEWDRALQIAEQLDKELPPTHAARAEVAYLRGRALESKGENLAAVSAYGAIIGPFPGSQRRLASDALKRSAALLEGNEDRVDELKALVHIYAKSFGNGKLWAEATADMKALLSEPIELDNK